MIDPSQISAMIFAAGRGTRMAPLTDTTPKPMIPVNGRPLIDYALDLVYDVGIRDVVVNTHYLPEALEEHVQSKGAKTIREQDLLETGGGLKNALPLLGGGPVVVLNSDSIWLGGNPIKALLANWSNEMGACLSLTQPNNAIGYKRNGDFSIDDVGRLERSPGLIYNGAHITRTDRLAEIDESVFSLNRLWDLFLAEKQLFGIENGGKWCDVGHPESIDLAEAALSE